MKKIILSPFVYKIKGVKNYTLVDLARQKLFRVTTEGNVEDVKSQLVKANLAIESEGVIPFKFEINTDKYKKYIALRELQVRITGNCNLNCNECGQICSCFKGGTTITDQLLTSLIDQCKGIIIEHVVITGGNPLTAPNILEIIRKNIAASKFSILFRGDLKRNDREQLETLGIETVSLENMLAEKNEKNMKADAFTFFYSQSFNPCWGNKVAVDIDGSIKPCLWSGDNLGNILTASIRDLISKGAFDSYWEITKDKTDTCKHCEYRYGCTDCRVLAAKINGSIFSKHPMCHFEPLTGNW